MKDLIERFLHDEVILLVTAMILVFWFSATCTAITGITMANRSHTIGRSYSNLRITHATAAEMRDVWELPIILTVFWLPIIAWRAWTVRRTPPV